MGSSFVAIRDTGQTLSAGSLALGRLLVGLVVLGVAAAIRREPLPRRRDLPNIAAFGALFLGVYSVTLNAAGRRVDAGTPSCRTSAAGTTNSLARSDPRPAVG